MKIFSEVRMSKVGQSGHVVLAGGVSPKRAAQIIAAQPPTPGVIVWRCDYTADLWRRRSA